MIRRRRFESASHHHPREGALDHPLSSWQSGKTDPCRRYAAGLYGPRRRTEAARSLHWVRFPGGPPRRPWTSRRHSYLLSDRRDKLRVIRAWADVGIGPYDGIISLGSQGLEMAGYPESTGDSMERQQAARKDGPGRVSAPVIWIV